MATLKKRGEMWYSDLRLNGKRVQRALNSDKRIAEKLLNEMVLTRRAEQRGETPRDVSIDFFRARHRTIAKDEQTKYRDELAFRMLTNSIPVTKLSQITPELLHRVIEKWKAEKKSTWTIATAIKKIKAAMRVAESWRYTTIQPWHSVKVSEPPGRMEFFTMKEMGQLLPVCHGEWRTFAMLCGFAGLRPAEAYHLEWSDIDFIRGTIWIHKKEGWTPKKRKERRVPLLQELRDYLEALPKLDRFVLGDDRMTLGSLLTYFARLVRKAKLKGSAYKLRHTFASQLVMAGANIKAVGTMMGHGKSSTTDIYAHLAPEVLQSEVEKMPKLASGLHPVKTAIDILRVI